MSACPYCKKPIETGWSYCHHCNKPLIANLERNPLSSRDHYSYNQEKRYDETIAEDIDFDFNIIKDEETERKIADIDRSMEQRESLGEVASGTLLLKKASLLYKIRDLSGAYKILENALNIFTDEGDRLNMAIVNGELGLIQEELGFYDSSIYHFERSIEILEKINDKPKLIQVFNNLANIYYILKDIEHSYEYYDKALKLAEGENLVAEEIKTSSNLVDVLFLLKNYHRIGNILRRNLQFFEHVGDLYGTIITLTKLGKLNFYLGEDFYSQALQELKKALEMIQMLSNSGQITPLIKAQLEWECFLYQGKLHLIYSNDKLSEDNLLKSLEAIRTFEVSETINEGIILENLAGSYEVRGEIHKAIEYFKLCSEIYYKFGNDFKNAEIKTRIGNAYFKLLDNSTEALNYYEEAIDIYDDLNYTKETADTSQVIGDIYILKGIVESALSYFERAKELYQVVNDTQNLNIIIEKINSLEFI